MTYAGICYDGPLEGQSHVARVRRFIIPVVPDCITYDSYGTPNNIASCSYRWSAPLRKWVFES